MSKLMHNVRAYKYFSDFCYFYISAYTTLNKLFAVFICNISGFIKIHYSLLVFTTTTTTAT